MWLRRGREKKNSSSLALVVISRVFTLSVHDTISGKKGREGEIERERERERTVLIDGTVLNRHMHRAFICGKSDFRLSGASRSFPLSLFLSLRFPHLDCEHWINSYTWWSHLPVFSTSNNTIQWYIWMPIYTSLNCATRVAIAYTKITLMNLLVLSLRQINYLP